jgi:hypothetical protein
LCTFFRDSAPRSRFIITCVAAWSLVACIPNALHAAGATFFIAANPLSYSILNRYQQPLSGADRKVFLPYSPFQIVDENTTLGDQITPAMKVRLLDQDFFFVRDEKGKLVGEAKGSRDQSIKNCEPVDDSVRVLRNGSVILSQTFPTGHVRTSVHKDEVLVRVFKCRDRYYCLLTGAGERQRFGWCDLPVHAVGPLHEHVAVEAPSAISPLIRSRVSARIRDANRTYREYFDYFNKLTSEQKSVPYWTCDTTGEQIRCSLNGGYNYAELLQESTKYLVQELRGMLVGEPLMVECTNGEVTVKLRAPEATP